MEVHNFYEDSLHKNVLTYLVLIDLHMIEYN